MAVTDLDARVNWALSYPFARPTHDYVFVDGGAYPLLAFEPSEVGRSVIEYHGQAMRLAELIGADRAAALAKQTLTPVLAVGSNASPIQLGRKYAHLTNVVVPVLFTTLNDHTIRYANRVVVYGSIPATGWPEPGARCRVGVTLLGEVELEVMNATEALGDEYELVRVAPDLISADALKGGPELLSYQSLTGCLDIALVEADVAGAPYPSGAQWDAQALAIKTLGLRRSVNAFVRENLSDPALRKDRDRVLSGR